MADDFIIPEASEDTILTFGIHKGQQIKNVPASYLMSIYDLPYVKGKHRDVWNHIHKHRKWLEEEAGNEEHWWDEASESDIY